MLTEHAMNLTRCSSSNASVKQSLRCPDRTLNLAKARQTSATKHLPHQASVQRTSPQPATGRRQLLVGLGAATWCAYDAMAYRIPEAAAASPTEASAASVASPPKLTGLSPEQLADRIRDDFVRKQYYVTGNLSSELFADDCLFTDPTIKVSGWKFYSDAVKTLFDADQSKADLISLEVLDGGDVQLKWRLEGVIKPWPGHPSIKPYTGVTHYVQDSDGLISKHLETWDTSIIDVFLSVFWKGFGAPPAPPVNA